MKKNLNNEILKKWNEAQKWEKNWHDNCVNSFNEEKKQLVYAEKMGLKMTGNNKTPYIFDLHGISILDLGGGPYSLLLKCENFSKATVVDPLDYPEWVIERYKSINITYIKKPAEELNVDKTCIYDEVWLYNVLQHTISPEKIIKNALQKAKLIRIFEWINTGTNKGHLHNLTEKNLDKWLGGKGKTEYIDKNGCRGDCYYGIFLGNNYDK
mgnify:CR=1 FL=1